MRKCCGNTQFPNILRKFSAKIISAFAEKLGLPGMRRICRKVTLRNLTVVENFLYAKKMWKIILSYSTIAEILECMTSSEFEMRQTKLSLQFSDELSGCLQNVKLIRGRFDVLMFISIGSCIY